MDPELQAPKTITLEQCIWQLAHKLEVADLHYGHGAVDAQSEALWIVSKQLGLSPTDALNHLDQICSAKQICGALKIMQTRISTHKPLAYILGEAWLMGIPFYSSEQSIVPRSWIAELIANSSLESW